MIIEIKIFERRREIDSSIYFSIFVLISSTKRVTIYTMEYRLSKQDTYLNYI